MVTDRRFCRFNKGSSTSTGQTDTTPITTREIPDGGFCLSSFLILSEASDPDSVLMGHLNPKAPWDHIGALDEKRIQAHSKGWMLPSCHLMIGESPQDAAERIACEQLDLRNLKLSEPKVVSETGASKLFPNLSNHWDIEFIFIGKIQRNELDRLNAWIDLEFIRPSLTERSSIARSHEDILESSGFRFRGS